MAAGWKTFLAHLGEPALRMVEQEARRLDLDARKLPHWPQAAYPDVISCEKGINVCFL